MNIIAINYGRPPKEYSSFDGAIKAAKGHSTQLQAQADGAKLAGRSFVGGQCSLDRWCLEFSGGIWLDITCSYYKVSWQVVHDKPEFKSADQPWAFQWPSGQSTVVDSKALLTSRVGAQFWQLWVNDVGFHVYLRGKLILWFHAVRRTDIAADLLYVSEDD